ncbi:MAG: hypothetical protein HY904_06580 [Deltaproteobacteria bacterium]|nr:hypothetical protein [Deltaproteobacteria bacterium]
MDPDHCGDCAVSCAAAPPGASRACGPGGCQYPCAAGFADCGAGCMDTTGDVNHCGGCTGCGAPTYFTPYCAGSACGTSCSAGLVNLNGHCASFAGVYRTNCRGCMTNNPYTGGCWCPAGFSPVSYGDLLDDSNCAGNGYGWATLYGCVAPALVPADFGGVYHHQGLLCLAVNPYTGACSCAAGTTAVDMPVSGSCFQRTELTVCYRPPVSTFGGAFTQSDHQGYGAAGCVAANPYTGACTCPAGTVGAWVRSIFGPLTACDNNGQWGSHVVFCYAP